MPTVHLETFINAPIEPCFDLSRSVDLHSDPPVGGVMSGLMDLDDMVASESVHMGHKRPIASRISKMERPYHFADVLIRGSFKKLVHEHTFQEKDGGTLLIDDFEFSSPGGAAGWLLDNLLLKSYMRKVMRKRNAHLKDIAESGQADAYIKKPKIVSPVV